MKPSPSTPTQVRPIAMKLKYDVKEFTGGYKADKEKFIKQYGEVGCNTLQIAADFIETSN